MPSGPTLRLAIACRHRKRSCRKRLVCLTLRFAQPDAGSTQPDSNLDAGIATRGRPGPVSGLRIIAMSLEHTRFSAQ